MCVLLGPYLHLKLLTGASRGGVYESNKFSKFTPQEKGY